MSGSIPVNGLTFDFDERWFALKWDDHDAWRSSSLCGFHETKAIDILALRDENELWLIEVGDIRGANRRISHKNQRKVRDESIDAEFAAKIRDTLAASVWAQGRVPQAKEIVRFLKAAWRGSEGKVHVVLWEEGIAAAEATAIHERVRSHLHWLNAKVRITNRTLSQQAPAAAIEGITVQSTPRTS